MKTSSGSLAWLAGGVLLFAACGGGGNDVTGSPSSPRTVFVSSAIYNGNLGGLGGADAACQGLANGAGLTGTFRAFLSDGTTAAANRITHSGPYVRTDGIRVADNWNALVSGALQQPIDVDEAGNSATTSDWTWTGTNPGGAAGTQTCSGWTTSVSASGPADTAHLGDVGQCDTTAQWQGSGDWLNCNLVIGHLYCVQQ